MRLLFDENISPVLVHQLADLYPDSLHVRDVGLQSADDDADSGGHRERRIFICTPVTLANQTYPIELTLTSRDTMRFPCSSVAPSYKGATWLIQDVHMCSDAANHRYD